MKFDKQRSHSQQLQTRLRRIDIKKQLILDILSKHQYALIDTYHLQKNKLHKFQIYRQLTQQIIKFNKSLQKLNYQNFEIQDITKKYNLYTNLQSRLKILDLYQYQQTILKSLTSIKLWYLNNIVDNNKKQSIFNKIGFKLLNNPNRNRYQQVYQKKFRTINPEYESPDIRLSQYKTKKLVSNFQQNYNQSPIINSTVYSQKSYSTIFPKSSRLQNNRQSYQKSNRNRQSSITSEILSQYPNLRNTRNKTITSPFNFEKRGIKSADKLLQKRLFHNNFSQKKSKNILLKKQIQDQTKKRIFSLRKQKSRISSQITSKIQRLNKQKLRKIEPQKKKYQFQDSKHRKFFSQKGFQANSHKKKSILFDEDIKIIKNFVKLKIAHQIPKKQFQITNEHLELNHRNMPIKELKTQKNLQSKENRKNSLSIKDHNKKQQYKILQPTIIQSQKHSIIQNNDIKGFLQKQKDIQNQITQHNKFKTILKYSKNIKHIEQYKLENVRAGQKNFGSFLTIFSKKKKTTFADILNKHHPKNYNIQTQNAIQKIKNILSTKGLSVNSNTISNSLKIPAQYKYIKYQKLYKTGDGLISNPMFPKYLYKQNK